MSNQNLGKGSKYPLGYFGLPQQLCFKHSITCCQSSETGNFRLIEAIHFAFKTIGFVLTEACKL